MSKEQEKRRTLIVEVNWIGDVLFSTPFIRAVKKADPGGYVACLVHPRCKDVLESNPFVDDIIIYDEDRRHKGLLGKIGLIGVLRKKRFDTVFLLHRSFTKALIAYLAGIGQRIGYPTKKRSRLLTVAVDEPAEEIHKIDLFLNILHASDIKPDGRSYDFFIGDAEKSYVADLLAKEGIKAGDTVISLCPGGNWDPKRWPVRNFARLCDRLSDNTGARIVITGAKRDSHIADEIKSEMKAPVVVMAGKTTLRQLAAVFERSGLVIANDTGSMHLAVSMKTPTVALFGPTSPDLTGPVGTGSYKVITGSDGCEIPCYDFTCRDNRCMKAITVDEVYNEAQKLLRKI